MKLSHLSYLIVLAGIFFLVGCVTQPDAGNTSVTSVAATSTTLADSHAEVIIDSFSCSLTPVGGEEGTTLDQVRAAVYGKARGPVGARLELPLLIWSTAEWNCGVWSQRNGALIAVGHTCVRENGQPQATNWSVTASGRVTKGSMKGSSRSYDAKIYLGNEIWPQNATEANTVCE